MKKLILTIAIILGSNLTQAQNPNLDTTDLYESLLAETIKKFKEEFGNFKEPYAGVGLDHRSSIGKLKNLFSDSGKTYREITDSLSPEFPGIFINSYYGKDTMLTIDQYFEKYIKNKSLKSFRRLRLGYHEEPARFRSSTNQVIEYLYFYTRKEKRVRFILISRVDNEIVSIEDGDLPHLGSK
jgi:hypothetical protein